MGGSRSLLAAAALLDVWVNGPHSLLVYEWLFYYFAYSVALLAFIWKPVRFTAGWGIAVHAGDVIAFCLFATFVEGPAGSVVMYFVFIVICGSLRWRSTGALLTTIAVIAGLGAAYGYATLALQREGLGLEPFVRRSLQLVVTAALVGYLGTYTHPLAGEISRVALWPRRLPRSSRALITDIVARSAEVFQVPSVLLVWMAPRNKQVNLAWQTEEGLVWAREPEGSYDPLVAPELERHSFQASDARKERGRVIHWTGSRFRHSRGHPINEELRSRFEMRRVQSWRLDGEFIQGRLFCFGRRRMQVDDLLVGELVARLAVSQLDSLYLVTQMEETAASEERLRLSRDLHDSLAQSLAGTALQLLAARRLLDFNPAASRHRLEEVQHQLKRDQLEVRSLIRRLRPSTSTIEYPGEHAVHRANLRERLEELRLRILKQWEINLATQLEIPVDDWPEGAVEQVFRLVQEAALNAARHAEASIIWVRISGTDRELRLAIEDNGKGYPFTGRFELADLAELGKGPLILRERVAALNGNLMLETGSTGTRVVMTLPSAVVET